MSPSNDRGLIINRGFTLVELMIAMVIGMLLVLAAMVLYVPVSRSLIDQGVIGQQTLSEAVNYDFDIMNTANAGYGIPSPQVNTNVILVTGSGPGNNTSVPIPSSGSAQGNGLFWNWVSPIATGVQGCAGVQVVASTTAHTTNERLVYYEEVSGGSCSPGFFNSPTNWDTVTLLPSVAASGTAPLTVTAAQDCDLRGSQIVSNPVLHPLVTFQLPIAQTLTGGFFGHLADRAPVTVCLHNLP